MKMVPRYLVMLAAYNGRQWIAEQVDSILDQEGVSVTLLISVDTSDDGTEQWVSERAAADARVQFLPHGEKFGGAARNFFRLIKEAPKGDFDYFSFADQDDIWLPGKLLQAANVMVERNSDGYSGNVIAFWPEGRERVIVKSQPQVQYDYLFEAAGPGCTYVFSKSLFCTLQTHLVDNFVSVQDVTLHDWYCYAFSRTRGFKWEIDSNCYMRYRQHANNQVGVNSGLKAFRARLSKVFDGWWLSQSLLISTLLGIRDTPFVRSWRNLHRLDLARLALAGFKCRRRLRDKFVFTGLCLTLVILRQTK